METFNAAKIALFIATPDLPPDSAQLRFKNFVAKGYILTRVRDESDGRGTLVFGILVHEVESGLDLGTVLHRAVRLFGGDAAEFEDLVLRFLRRLGLRILVDDFLEGGDRLVHFTDLRTDIADREE